MIKSPCVTICQIDRETRICEGCNRTIDEISNWSKYTDEQREKIMERNKK